MRYLPIPSESALAVHTRSAQLQDKVEQQHLKRLVLNYEQSQEAEELKGDPPAAFSNLTFDNNQLARQRWKTETGLAQSKFAMLANRR